MTSGTPIRAIDVHSHWSTKRGYPLQTEAELSRLQHTWCAELIYRGEAEMAEDFRQAGVRTILARCAGFSALTKRGDASVLALSDRIAGVARDGRPKGSLSITVYIASESFDSRRMSSARPTICPAVLGNAKDRPSEHRSTRFWAKPLQSRRISLTSAFRVGD